MAPTHTPCLVSLIGVLITSDSSWRHLPRGSHTFSSLQIVFKIETWMNIKPKDKFRYSLNFLATCTDHLFNGMLFSGKMNLEGKGLLGNLFLWLLLVLQCCLLEVLDKDTFPIGVECQLWDLSMLISLHWVNIVGIKTLYFRGSNCLLIVDWD